MNLLYKHPTRCMLALVLLGAVSTCHAQTEASCSVTHFTPPFSALPRGINSFATVVGSSGTTSGVTQGFIRYSGGGVKYYRVPNYNFTEFTNRNDKGVSIGFYGPDRFTSTQGFILSGSSFTSIAYPSPAAQRTAVFGINKWGSVVGFYIDSAQQAHGFKRYSNGSFVPINYPGAQSTTPAGINNSGTIVGSFNDAGGTQHGFVYRNGQWTQVDYPGLDEGTTSLRGISSAGVILGHQGFPHPGFDFLIENGVFEPITDPEADNGQTDVWGIAPNGLITGIEDIQLVQTGFIGTCQ